MKKNSTVVWRDYDVDCYGLNVEKPGKYILRFDDFQEKFAETVLDVIWGTENSGTNLANRMRESGENYCYINFTKKGKEEFVIVGLNDGSEYSFEIDFVEDLN